MKSDDSDKNCSKKKTLWNNWLQIKIYQSLMPEILNKKHKKWVVGSISRSVGSRLMSTEFSPNFSTKAKPHNLPDLDPRHHPDIARILLPKTKTAPSPISSTGSWCKHLEATAVVRLLSYNNGLASNSHPQHSRPQSVCPTHPMRTAWLTTVAAVPRHISPDSHARV